MNIFTLGIFDFLSDPFILTIVIIVLILVILGIVLMARNIRPILGLLLLIFAMAMVIGVSYDVQGMKRSFKNFWTNISVDADDDSEQENGDK